MRLRGTSIKFPFLSNDYDTLLARQTLRQVRPTQKAILDSREPKTVRSLPYS